MELKPSAAAEMERKLVTILSADVAEYSRLMAENEEDTLRVFREHKTVFEQLVALHRGRIFNTAGDAILAEFNSAVEAVRCATEIQSALRTRNDKLKPSRQVRFRIGVNLGDVVMQGTDLMGDGVNIAARLQGAAEPGGVCISGSVYDQIASKLQLSVHPMGERQYKNIPQAVRTFSVVSADGGPGLPAAKETRFGGSRALSLVAASAALVLLAAGAIYFRPRAPLENAPPTDLPKNAIPAAGAKPLVPLELPSQFTLSYLAPKTNPPAKWVVDCEYGPGAQHRSIAAAIEAASSGDIIEVRPGTYREHLVINKGVLIRGLPGADGKLSVRVEGAHGETMEVTNGESFLENLAVVMQSDGKTDWPSAIHVNGGHLNLWHVVVFGGGKFPSVAFNLVDGESRIVESEFTGLQGIVQSSGKLFCDGCVLRGSQEDGAVISNTGSPENYASVFHHLHAFENGTNGVSVISNGKVEIQGCQILKNKINGLQALGANTLLELNECDVSENGENGIVSTGNARIEFNKGQANRNHFSGIAATQESTLKIRNAEFSENGEFGYATLDNAQAAAEGVQSSGNKAGPLYRAPASTTK